MTLRQYMPFLNLWLAKNKLYSIIFNMLHTKSLIIPKTPIFDNAVGIVKKLKSKGFSAYFAGGCVRDLIMGREPVDIDIATSASPDDVISLFKKTAPVGKAFGVVIVIKSGIYIRGCHL